MPLDPHLPAPFEVIAVAEATVACDGGGGALGHPRVFLTLVDGMVVCPYCSRTFVLQGSEAERRLAGRSAAADHRDRAA
ncbi:MAG: zinc-finger domain-containing protein [Elioraea sp.]|nr:zinc-finger domain-containing protein [Elioraea sp.]MDW8443028.1 zinc-finger domain-containing protein [Acetobacteraceae bacterium]